MSTGGLAIMLGGLIIGLAEILISLIAFKEAKRTNSRWLFWFSIGTFVLGTGHLTCKVIGHGILGLPVEMALGVFFKTVGLSVTIYSILSAASFKWMRVALALILISAAYFLLGSIHTFFILHDYHNVLSYYLPHVVFLVLLPWLTASALLYVYILTKDIGALIFGAGMGLYGIGTLFTLVMILNGYEMFSAMIYEIVIRLSAIGILLLGFFAAE